MAALGAAIAFVLGGCGRRPVRESESSLPAADRVVAPTRPFDLAELASRGCRELADADSTVRARVLALYEGGRGRACVFRTGHTIEGEATRQYLLVDDGRARAVRDHPRNADGYGLLNRVDRCTLGPPPWPGSYCSTDAASCIRLTCWSPDLPAARFIY